MELNNKTIIITGAARIGQVVAQELKKRGANLVITYLKDEAEAGKLGLPVLCDVTKSEDIARVIKTAKEKFGSVDGLIHMAANYEKTDWQNFDEKTWDKTMNIIAKSSLLFGKMASDAMAENNGEVKGKIIFFSDWSVLTRPYDDYVVYNAAKSAVVGLTKSLAKKLAPSILVNAIAPGPIIRPPDLSDAENEEAMAGTLLKRWGGAEEIAKGVLYLLDADFVTGQILTIDGGRTIT